MSDKADTQTQRVRTEGDLQDALYCHFGGKNHPLTIPNCGAGCVMGEADLISVTKARYVHEVEIKRSREDFRRDFRQKEDKHKALEQGYRRVREWRSRPDETIVYANYFWFAWPEGLVNEDQIPEYAGLLEVKDNARVVESRYIDRQARPPTVMETKKAPRLNTEKIDDDAFMYIARGLSARYWDRRTNDAYWEDLL